MPPVRVMGQALDGALLWGATGAQAGCGRPEAGGGSLEARAEGAVLSGVLVLGGGVPAAAWEQPGQTQQHGS